MPIERKWKKRQVKFFSVLFFTCILINVAFYELFRSDSKNLPQTKLLTKLIPQDFLLNPSSISLKNRLGSFLVNRGEPEDFYTWFLNSPRILPANQKLVGDIFNNLANITITKIFQKDPLNLSNFSLDDPLYTIKIAGVAGKEFKINFGLKTSVNDSIYLTVDERPFIYQVQAPNLNFEKLDIGSFVEARIFPIDIQNVDSIIVKNSQSSRPRLDINQKADGIWYGHDKQKLITDRVHEYFNAINEQKAHIILDQRSEKTNQRIKEYLKRPPYKVSVKTKDQKTYTYQMSWPISSLADVKIETPKNYILVTGDLLKHPVLVSKKLLKILNLGEYKLKSTSIKKLFY